MNGKYLDNSGKRNKRPIGCCIGAVITLLVLILAAGAVIFWLYGPALLEGITETQPGVSESEPENHTKPDTTTLPPQPEDPTGQSIPDLTIPSDPVTAQAQRILDSMTTEEKIYQLFIVTQEQITGIGTVTQSGEASREAIEKYPVGGIVYFAANILSREQTTAMIENIQSYSELGLFIAVDEEGGAVARIGKNKDMGTTAFPAMGVVGKTEDPAEAYRVGYTIGTEIAELGFNLDFAPVADVNSNPDNPVIGTRAFHADPEITAEMVASCVEGFVDSGMLCTIKHFPGHGDTRTDSHYGEAETVKDLDQLMECEMLPFISGIEAGAQFVMIGHIGTPNVTNEDVPATLSHEIVTGLLRGELGFNGLVITDSMMMQAITDRYSAGEAAVMALQAGVDIILAPQSLTEAVAGIEDALENGTLTEQRIDESVLRILETKIRSGIIEAE